MDLTDKMELYGSLVMLICVMVALLVQAMLMYRQYSILILSDVGALEVWQHFQHLAQVMQDNALLIQQVLQVLLAEA